MNYEPKSRQGNRHPRLPGGWQEPPREGGSCDRSGVKGSDATRGRYLNGTVNGALAHATAYVAAAPKSNRAGAAYWSAMDDVLRHGSLPVPNHLRSATWREKKDFGHGRGYLYPQDYEGADVEQQYLPDVLAKQGRNYYRPSDHGYERTIAERMENRRGAREAATAAGGPRPELDAHGKTNAMKVAGNVMAQREERKRSLASRQKREA